MKRPTVWDSLLSMSLAVLLCHADCQMREIEIHYGLRNKQWPVLLDSWQI